MNQPGGSKTQAIYCNTAPPRNNNIPLNLQWAPRTPILAKPIDNSHQTTTKALNKIAKQSKLSTIYITSKLCPSIRPTPLTKKPAITQSTNTTTQPIFTKESLHAKQPIMSGACLQLMSHQLSAPVDIKPPITLVQQSMTDGYLEKINRIMLVMGGK